MEEQQKHFTLSRDFLKYFAVFCMVLDHIAWYFLAFRTPTAQVFHILGRITAPVMCFFLAQGARYTHNMARYLMRMLIFAVAAQLPWWCLHKSQKFSLNMLFTLFFCLLMLYIDSLDLPVAVRAGGIVLCILATNYCDWSFHAPLWCLIFYHLHSNRKKETLAFSIVALSYYAKAVIRRLDVNYTPQQALTESLFTLGVFLALPLLFLADQSKQEGKRSAFSKWFFYVFYPLHLGIIALIKIFTE